MWIFNKLAKRVRTVADRTKEQIKTAVVGLLIMTWIERGEPTPVPTFEILKQTGLEQSEVNSLEGMEFFLTKLGGVVVSVELTDDFIRAKQRELSIAGPHACVSWVGYAG